MSTDRALEALQIIPADLPREDWVKIGMAAKSAGLSFDDFDNWSQNAANYKASDCKDTWRSIKDNGGIGVGTLFHIARQHGFRPSVSPSEPLRAIPVATPSDEHASAVWARCVPLDPFHPYPIQKGMDGEPLKQLRQLPDDDALTIAGHPMKGALVVPAYAADGSLQSLQFVPNGSPKMNLPGHPMKGASFTVGTVTEGQPVYVVEGVGQAFACWHATGCAAVVTFGCGNMDTIARTLRGHELVLVPDAGQERKATETAAALGCKVATMPEGSPANFDACDYMQSNDRQALADLLNSARGAGAVLPLVDPKLTNVAYMLDTPPPARRWLLKDVLPLGVVGVLAAGGGTGKSYLSLQLAVCMTAGRPFLGIDIGESGSVLMLAAEDEADEIHRRLRRIVDTMKHDGDLDDYTTARVAERLHIASRVGHDNRLTADMGGQVVPTDTGERISALANALPNVRLIILDPVSRFRGGDENANEAATRFVEQAEAIRAATGATVLMPHHMNKAGLRGDADTLSMEDMRGASALADGVRWVAMLATMRKDAAAKYNLKPEDASHYVRLDTVKNSYAAPWPGLWLERIQGGVLVPTSINLKRESKQKQKDDDQYQTVIGKVLDKVRKAQTDGQPLTRRKLREYAGRAGVFGVGDHTLRGIISRALDQSQLREVEQDGQKVLQTW